MLYHRVTYKIRFIERKFTMKMKKTLALVMAIMMIVGTMAFTTSCSYKGYDFDNDDTLVMVTNAAFPPYEYTDPDGPFNGYAGIDVEIAMEIAKRLGKTLEIKDVEFDSVISGINTGKYDIALAGLTVTPDRQKSVNFSNSYATGVQVMIVRKDSAYTSIDDFFNYDDDGNPVSLKNTDVKIGVQKTTTGDIYSSDDITNFGFNELNDDGSVKGTDRVTKYNTGADAVEALKTGKVDVVIIDNEPAKSFVNQNSDSIRILETTYAEEDYAIAINKKSTVLLEKVNEALAAMKADGTIEKIVRKYIPVEE